MNCPELLRFLLRLSGKYAVFRLKSGGCSHPVSPIKQFTNCLLRVSGFATCSFFAASFVASDAVNSGEFCSACRSLG